MFQILINNLINLIIFCNVCNALYATLLFLLNSNSNVSAILTDMVISFTDEGFYIFYSVIMQKHTAEIAESGVMIYFSFLLLDIKFIIVLNERYTAMMIQIIFVAFSENQNGIRPPICNIMTTKISV